MDFMFEKYNVSAFKRTTHHLSAFKRNAKKNGKRRSLKYSMYIKWSWEHIDIVFSVVIV